MAAGIELPLDPDLKSDEAKEVMGRYTVREAVTAVLVIVVVGYVVSNIIQKLEPAFVPYMAVLMALAVAIIAVVGLFKRHDTYIEMWGPAIYAERTAPKTIYATSPVSVLEKPAVPKQKPSKAERREAKAIEKRAKRVLRIEPKLDLELAGKITGYEYAMKKSDMRIRQEVQPDGSIQDK